MTIETNVCCYEIYIITILIQCKMCQFLFLGIRTTNENYLKLLNFIK